MDREELMIVGTILKFGLGLIGLSLTIVFLILGLINKDNKKLKKAGIIFIGTWVILITLGTIEFLILTK